MKKDTPEKRDERRMIRCLRKLLKGAFGGGA